MGAFALRRGKESYDGIEIAATPGLHLAVAESVIRHVKRESGILELGAYRGALVRRLLDLRYSNIMAADLDNHLTIGGISHVRCDFNDEFASRFGEQKFDCVVAVEVIEHLNDVRKFLSQCANLLKKDGIVIVSTPNIGFFEGRIKFFLTGELWGFGAKNYLSQRHISPVSVEQFPLLMAETGFASLELYTVGSFATWLRTILTSIFWVPMRLAFGRFTVGECLICVARRGTDDLGGIKFQSKDLWSKSRNA